MLDFLTLVSWTDWNRPVDDLIGLRLAQWIDVYSVPDFGQARFDVFPIPRMGARYTYSVMCRPNQVVGNSWLPYSWVSLRSFIAMLWNIETTEWRCSGPIRRAKKGAFQAILETLEANWEAREAGRQPPPRVRGMYVDYPDYEAFREREDDLEVEEFEWQGYKDVPHRLRIRVSRYDLNSDVEGHVEDFLPLIARPYSRITEMYYKSGRLSGMVIGTNPRLRIEQKSQGSELGDVPFVRIEFQHRPRNMVFHDLEQFFQMKFSFCGHTKLGIADATYEGGNKLLARAFEIVRDTEGLQVAWQLLTKRTKEHIRRVDREELRNRIDEGYWRDFHLWGMEDRLQPRLKSPAPRLIKRMMGALLTRSRSLPERS